MAEPKDETEFDPATWTPSKPWPKGYYKPIMGPDDPGYFRNMHTYYRLRNGIPADYPSYAQATAVRAIVWFVFACLFHLMEIGFVRAALHSGLAHAIASRFTPWPVFVVLTLLAPTLLYARIVAAPGSSFRRAALAGLGWSLALLALRCVILGLPIPAPPP